MSKIRVWKYAPSNSTCVLMSDSLRPCGPKPTRFLCPWDSPGKNNRVGCHFLLQEIFPTQGSNPHLLCFLPWQANFFLPLCHLGFTKPPPTHAVDNNKAKLTVICHYEGRSGTGNRVVGTPPLSRGRAQWEFAMWSEALAALATHSNSWRLCNACSGPGTVLSA